MTTYGCCNIKVLAQHGKKKKKSSNRGNEEEEMAIVEEEEPMVNAERGRGHESTNNIGRGVGKGKKG